MNGTQLYVALEDALVVAWDDQRWRQRLVLDGKTCQCVAIDPAASARAYCGTADHGLWRTNDGGESWDRVAGELRTANVTAVATAPQGPTGSTTIYAGTEPSRIFRSIDNGDSWNELRGLTALPSAASWSFPPRPDTHHVRWITIDAHNPDRLFVAIEAGALVRSDDGGRSWHDRVSDGPYDTHTLLIAPARDGLLISAAGDGYFESADGGRRWRKPENGLHHRYLWSAVTDPRDPGAVIVSAASSPFVAHSARRAESWIYRKDGDSAWRAVRDGLPDPAGTTISSLASTSSTEPALYAASNRGVFWSGNGGLSWNRLDLDWPERFQTQRVTGLCAITTRL
jgi:photosystem II stability/assembly factor-like uncharacterized protein